jgi:two-component system sporulation sensor kinase B
MKGLLKYAVFIAFVFAIFSSILVQPTYAQANSEDNDTIYINEWEMKWETNPDATIEDIMSDEQAEGWFPVSYENDLPEKPEDIHVVWLKIDLPNFDLNRPSLLIHKLLAEDVTIFINKKIIYRSQRDYAYNKNEILLPLSSTESGQSIFIKLMSYADTIGLNNRLTIGEHAELSQDFMKIGVMDVILGASLVFIAISMFISIFFVNKTYLVGWNSLSTVILSVGLMIITYSPFIHSGMGNYGAIFYYLFDFSSTLLMPALFFFFEKVFGKGPLNSITIFRKIQVLLAAINLVFFFLGFLFNEIRDWYLMISFITFGGFILISSVLLIFLLIFYSKQGNKDAIILSIGSSTFTAIGSIEVVRFFMGARGSYLFLWKWGILCFIVSLVVILVRRIMLNYEQVVKYSKQLEVFNNELQRSEKMEMISQLAASVAHEVRNPLQVTRGFLQILGGKSENEKDKGYMQLAIDELDRASEIITDFLTFAKPQMEQTNVLDLANELYQIEGILVPLATMQGGVIKTDITGEFYIRGNSSKFKQALINIIKNSIEALGEDGLIQINANKNDKSNEIVIRIKDNGEGINEADLMRLGEPYYSKKTKGTGLGLMVTFRIIELMDGRVEYFSTKGVGTEAVIHLPAVEKITPSA